MTRSTVTKVLHRIIRSACPAKPENLPAAWASDLSLQLSLRRVSRRRPILRVAVFINYQ
jgi:hypothetical protein